jgi:uncharacterized membrane protein YbaN (DUF454 family)
MAKERNKKRSIYLHIIIKILAVFFLMLGVLGLFLPVMPGVVFLVIGLILLGEESWLGQKIILLLPKKVKEAIKEKHEKKG